MSVHILEGFPSGENVSFCILLVEKNGHYNELFYLKGLSSMQKAEMMIQLILQEIKMLSH